MQRKKILAVLVALVLALSASGRAKGAPSIEQFLWAQFGLEVSAVGAPTVIVPVAQAALLIGLAAKLLSEERKINVEEEEINQPPKIVFNHLFPVSRVDETIPDEVYDQFDTTMAAAATVIAAGRALNQAIDRHTTAVFLGDSAAEQIQLAAATQYFFDFRDALLTSSEAITQFRNVYLAAGLPNPVATKTTMLTFIGELNLCGFPATEVPSLNQLNATEERSRYAYRFDELTCK